MISCQNYGFLLGDPCENSAAPEVYCNQRTDHKFDTHLCNCLVYIWAGCHRITLGPKCIQCSCMDFGDSLCLEW